MSLENISPIQVPKNIGRGYNALCLSSSKIRIVKDYDEVIVCCRLEFLGT